MSQASELIAQQFINGGVVPADLVGQSAVSKAYVDNQNAIQDVTISTAVSAAGIAQAGINSHIASPTAHTAQSITYSGTVLGVGNTKQALDKLKQEINDLVLGGDDADPNTRAEVEIARGGHDTLGDRLDANLPDVTLNPSQTTVEIQSDLNSAVDVIFTAGTYTIGQITIPSTVKSISCRGNVKLIPDSSVPKDTAASWITALSLTDAEIKGFSFEVDEIIYPQLRCFDLTLCTNVLVERVKAIKGGGIAIYGAQCVDVTVRKCKVSSFAIKGISFDGAQQYNNHAEDCIVIGNGLAHCYSFQLGKNPKVTNCYGRGAQTFGVGMYQVSGGKVLDSEFYNTGKEAVNFEDSSYCDADNITAEWDAGIGTDFGMSMYGSAVATQFNTFSNCTIINSFASGVALADNVSFCDVVNVKVFNANQGAIANQAGILLYGDNCVKNKVSGNTVVDTLSHSNYGISEYDFGTGAASLNEITGNYVEGYVTGDIRRTDTTTSLAMNNKDLTGFRTYTPTVGASAGAITTSSATGYYMQLGKIIFFYARVTVTTNGTGAGALRIGLPFTAVRGSGSGKELATSGKALTAEIGASQTYAEVRAYDNTYPATNGSIVDIQGVCEII